MLIFLNNAYHSKNPAESATPFLLFLLHSIVLLQLETFSFVEPTDHRLHQVLISLRGLIFFVDGLRYLIE